MGTWGVGLYQNDVADDARSAYKNFLSQGQSDEEAFNNLLEVVADELDDHDDGPLFWMAIADTQWKLGRLDDSIKQKALKAIADENTDEIYAEAGKAAIRRRKAVLEELQNRLLSEQPERKKIRIIKPYVNDWRNGDIYVLPITGSAAKEYGFAGQYLMLYKIGDYIWNELSSPHHVDAVVRVKITENGRLPNGLDEFNELEFIPFCTYCGVPEYAAELHASSNRQTPKDLKYWDNFPNIRLPENEYLSKCPQMLLMKDIEIMSVYRYLQFSKRLPADQLEVCRKLFFLGIKPNE